VTTLRTSAPRRQAADSALRRLSRNVLIIGSVVAVVAAFGPVWAVRVGVAVAVVAAVVACLYAWREVAEGRRSHAAEMLAASRAHGASLSEERRHNATVLDAMTVRARVAAAELHRSQQTIVTLTATIRSLRGEVSSWQRDASSLRGDLDRAREEIRQREGDIASLRETVRAREAELIALSEASGQVRAIPRRVLAEHEGASEPAQPDPQPEFDVLSDGILAEDYRPSVVSLVDAAVVMPNYEGERRRA
jgi:flagellar motility protein MotE (MotC chaperone)